MTRVLHVINDLDYGGAATQLRLLAGASREWGEASAVASLRRPGAEATRLRAAGVPITWLKGRFAIDPFAVWNLRRLVGRERPEVLQSWDEPSAALCRAVRRLRSTRWLHTLRGGELGSGKGADRLIVSDASVGAGTEGAVVVPNAFDPGLVSGLPINKLAARERLRESGIDVSDDAPVVVSVARIDHPAAVRELAWTADLVRVVCPGLRFLIAGGGPGLMACERFSAAATEAGTNVFLGPWDDLRTLYAAADVAWCAAGRGAAPTPALEAMASRLPVVIADAPGRDQLLPVDPDGPVCRLPWDDRAAWARVTMRLLTDRPLAEAIGERNAAGVRERHALAGLGSDHNTAVG